MQLKYATAEQALFITPNEIKNENRNTHKISVYWTEQLVSMSVRIWVVSSLWIELEQKYNHFRQMLRQWMHFGCTHSLQLYPTTFPIRSSIRENIHFQPHSISNTPMRKFQSIWKSYKLSSNRSNNKQTQEETQELFPNQWAVLFASFPLFGYSFDHRNFLFGWNKQKQTNVIERH